MISLQRSMHSSQMYTPGPAMSFFTCFCDLPQKEHFNSSPVSPNFATCRFPSLLRRRHPWRHDVSVGWSPTVWRIDHDESWTRPTIGPITARSADGTGAVHRLARGDHPVDDAIFEGLVGLHDEIAVGVGVDALDRLAGVIGEDLVDEVTHPHDLLGRQFEIGDLAVADLPTRLVQQDAAVRQRETLSLGAGGEQDSCCRGGLAEADGGDVVLDELHRVVDGEQRGDVATRAVDVDVDVLVGVLRLEVDQLCTQQAGDLVVDRCLQEDDVLLEQPAVEVVGALAPTGLLDDVRNQVVHRIEIHDVVSSSLLGSGSSSTGSSAGVSSVLAAAASVAAMTAAAAALTSAASCSESPWPPSSSWLWPRRASRSIGAPSGSTKSTWWSSQSNAFDLRIWAMRSGTASFCSYALRMSLAFCWYCMAIRAYSASRSWGSTSTDSASAIARSARSTLTASTEAPRIDSTNWSGSWPVAASHCPRSMPCAWNCCTVPCTRWLRSASTIGSGGSISTSSASASFMARTTLWRASFSLRSAIVSRRLSSHSSTVSNSPRFSDSQSSVSSGTCDSCTAVTLTTKSASSSRPLGVEVKVISSPTEAPVRCSSKSSVTQPWPSSYDQSSVLRPISSSPSRVAARSRVRKSPT